MNKLVLKINGVGYENTWQKFHSFRTMESMSGAFSIAAPNFSREEFNIRMGSSYVLEIDSQKINSGYIDEINIDYDSQSSFINFGGRDKTADLIDSTYGETQNEWKNQTIRNIITNLITPFSISLEVDSSVSSKVSTPIETFKADEGEYVYTLISRLCRDNGILPITKGEGKLVLTQATTTEKTKDSIELGVNALKGSLKQSDVERYSRYTVKGYGIGGDSKSLSDFTSPSGVATDSIITRTRTLTMFADGLTDSGKCKTRASWESMIRAGKSRLNIYKVENWIQSDGKVWDINKLVRIKDSFMGIDTTMLIDRVDFMYSREEGKTTLIRVVNKNTYTSVDNQSQIKTEYDS